LREVVLRSPQGEVIGRGSARRMHPPPPGPSEGLQDAQDDEGRGGFGRGPEFIVQLQDGQTVHVHLPRPPRKSWFAPLGFFGTLALVALAVALATYPIVRRLTRRLEDLQAGVERWGQGDLGVRVAAQGEDEVGFLAQRFNHAAARIEALLQSRDALLASQKSLLANASHELRSPLTRIRMGLELMNEDNSDASKKEIARNIAELDQLIDEILLASRLDAQEADMGTIESVDLMGLCAEECARMGALLEVQSGVMQIETQGVPKLLRRLIRNLLENAARYGVAKGPEDVQLSCAITDKDIVLKVCDRGPGVPVAFREKIFEPFFRLPGASERAGSVGLGLALVKSIALRHQGRVTCSDRLGGGACFEVSLPKTSH
jgi:signal transduction histidine kinase